MKRGVIFKEIYYCRNQMKNTRMKRGLNADFKNIKIILGSKNFFFLIFENFLSPTWTYKNFKKISKKKIFSRKIFWLFYCNLTKNFIEHNLFSSKSYTNMSKNMPGGL